VTPVAAAGDEHRPVMPEEQVLQLAQACSNQGRWGPDDELGTLNFIEPATRLAALATVRIGRPVSIGQDLDTVRSPANPVPVVHRMLYAAHDGANAAFDVVEIAAHGLAVTHLDAVAHMFAEGQIYNGRAAGSTVTPAGLAFGSIHAQRDGILTRGVLLDVPASQGLPWLEPTARIYPGDLDQAEALGQVTVRRGDAVFVRTGVTARVRATGPEDPSRRAGLMPECAGWFHQREVALFSGDCYDHVPLPYTRLPAPFHQIALACMGMPFLDATDLETLSATCAGLGRYEFLLTVAPLRIRGGTGSAVNPICYF
jgi:kynurenine formamidase